MAKWTTTLVLLMLMLVAGGWIWWDLNQEPQAPKGMGPLLPELPVGRLLRIKIDRIAGDGQDPKKREQLIFEKSKDRWKLIEPVQSPVDADRITALTNGPAMNWPTAYVDVTGAADFEKFGLGPEALRVTFYLPEASQTIVIGRVSAQLQGTYAMVEGADKAAIVSLDFARAYDRPVASYVAKAEAENSGK